MAVKVVTKASIVHMEGRLPLEVVLLQQVEDIPGVAHILQHFDLGESFALIMETSPHTKVISIDNRWTPVQDLFDLIVEQGHLEEDLARKVFSQVVETVVDCHNHGVLHRDIKDENILVDTDTMKIKLIDFGSGCHLGVHHKVFRKFSG